VSDRNEAKPMTVRQHLDLAQRKPRYSKEEFAQRGNEIYETQVRSQVEAGNTWQNCGDFMNACS
jgi:hypothetical protein